MVAALSSQRSLMTLEINLSVVMQNSSIKSAFFLLTANLVAIIMKASYWTSPKAEEGNKAHEAEQQWGMCGGSTSHHREDQS